MEHLLREHYSRTSQLQTSAAQSAARFDRQSKAAAPGPIQPDSALASDAAPDTNKEPVTPGASAEHPNSPDTVSSEDADPMTVDGAKKTSSRKTEQNRRAQQRYRRRKKEMFEEQQRLNAELSLHIDHLLQENSHTQARASFLEEVIDLKDNVILSNPSAAAASEVPIIGFADAMLDLIQVLQIGQDMRTTRQHLLEATAELLTGQVAGMAFVRKNLVLQLGQCLLQLDQQQAPAAARSRICELIGAYVNMIQKAGAANPHAFLTYLALPVQSDQQQLHDVLHAAQLRPDQEHQLVEAHAAFQGAMTQLAEERKRLTAALHSTWPGADCHVSSLVNLNKGQNAVEAWQQSLAEEKRNLLTFYNITVLVLDPYQHARAMVTSFPAGVNMLAICSLLADQAHLPSNAASYGEHARGLSLPLPASMPLAPGMLSSSSMQRVPSVRMPQVGSPYSSGIGGQELPHSSPAAQQGRSSGSYSSAGGSPPFRPPHHPLFNPQGGSAGSRHGQLGPITSSHAVLGGGMHSMGPLPHGQAM